MKTKIKVRHDGKNTWLAPTILQSSCKINVHYFPFDEQVGIYGLHAFPPTSWIPFRLESGYGGFHLVDMRYRRLDPPKGPKDLRVTKFDYCLPPPLPLFSSTLLGPKCLKRLMKTLRISFALPLLTIWLCWHLFDERQEPFLCVSTISGKHLPLILYGPIRTTNTRLVLTQHFTSVILQQLKKKYQAVSQILNVLQSLATSTSTPVTCNACVLAGSVVYPYSLECQLFNHPPPKLCPKLTLPPQPQWLSKQFFSKPRDNFHSILFSKSCSLKFGSWTYDAWRVDIVAEGPSADTKTTQVNGEWDLISFPCQRNVDKYECCPEPYSDVTCTLKIRRRTTYFFVNLIVPCFLITRKSNTNLGEVLGYPQKHSPLKSHFCMRCCTGYGFRAFYTETE